MKKIENIQKSDYIPIWQYAENRGCSPTSVYGWIRQGKFEKEDVIKVEVLQKKYRIRSDAKPKMLRIK